MYTKDLIVNHRRQCEEIKHVCKVIPYICTSIFAGALCIKPIGLESVARYKANSTALSTYLRYSTALVVSADKLNSVWVPKLQTCQKRNRLYGE